MVHNPEHDKHKGLLAWWAKNSVAANLLMLIALIGGVVGYFSMQRENNPGAVFPGASISVAWPGASPQEIEEQIIVRIEEALSDLDGVDELEAVAREGSGSVYVSGLPSQEASAFIDEIKLRVDSINNMPREAYRPQVQRWQNSDQIAGFALHGQVERRDLQRVAREIRNEISSTIPGASLVEVMGNERTQEAALTAARRCVTFWVVRVPTWPR